MAQRQFDGIGPAGGAGLAVLKHALLPGCAGPARESSPHLLKLRVSVSLTQSEVL